MTAEARRDATPRREVWPVWRSRRMQPRLQTTDLWRRHAILILSCHSHLFQNFCLESLNNSQHQHTICCRYYHQASNSSGQSVPRDWRPSHAGTKNIKKAGYWLPTPASSVGWANTLWPPTTRPFVGVSSPWPQPGHSGSLKCFIRFVLLSLFQLWVVSIVYIQKNLTEWNF